MPLVHIVTGVSVAAPSIDSSVFLPLDSTVIIYENRLKLRDGSM